MSADTPHRGNHRNAYECRPFVVSSCARCLSTSRRDRRCTGARGNNCDRRFACGRADTRHRAPVAHERRRECGAGLGSERDRRREPGPLAHDRVGGRQVGRRCEPERPRWGRGDVRLHGFRDARRRYAELGGKRTAHGRESEQRGCHRRGREQCRRRPERDVRRLWRELDDSGQRKRRLQLQLLVLGRTRELEPDEHGDDQLAGTDPRGLQFPGCRLRFHQRDRRLGRSPFDPRRQRRCVRLAGRAFGLDLLHRSEPRHVHVCVHVQRRAPRLRLLRQHGRCGPGGC